MPDDEVRGNAPEDSKAAIDSAWETLHHTRRKRHDLHELVRELWGARAIADEFDDRLGDVTGRLF